MEEHEHTNESVDNDQTKLSYETTELSSADLVNDNLVSKNIYEGLDKDVKQCKSGKNSTMVAVRELFLFYT